MCENDVYGLAYTDITTGEFKACQGSFDLIVSELARISPSEIIAPSKQQKILPFQIVPEEIIDLPKEITSFYNCSKVGKSFFDPENSKSVLKQLFNVATLESFCKDTNTKGLSVQVQLQGMFVKHNLI